MEAETHKTAHTMTSRNGSSVVPPVMDNATAQIELDSFAALSHSQEYTAVQTKMRKVTIEARPAKDDDEPLIDTTATLPKNSKKTRRLQKQQEKRQQKASSKIGNLLELPPELLFDVLGHLGPRDVLCMSQLNCAMKDFVEEYEVSITKHIIRSKYWVLSRCFPLPKPLHEVDEESQTALLHPRRQKMTEVHRKPYQHIRPSDNQRICTCAACILTWNNLNVVLDLAQFQDNLNRREPIPMIPRGTQPEWNTLLIERHARIVERAMTSPLTYAAILETHLDTTVATLLRQTLQPQQKPQPVHRHNKPATLVAPQKATTPVMLYDFRAKSDSEAQDDSFLERPGKESYEFPWHRDNYYSLLAYVPNRKWSKVEQKWVYYIAGAHERDLEWARKWFLRAPPSGA